MAGTGADAGGGRGGKGRLAVALIADDLSGALDSTAPFAALGFSCAVAVTAEHAAAALASGASVVAVNTASRHLPATEAARRVAAAAHVLVSASPSLAFKKVDSRLKGNVAAETRAMMAAMGRTGVLAAPAVPELGRQVSGGFVHGRGVVEPIDVHGAFAGLDVEVPDVEDAQALDAVARRAVTVAGDTLVVGARSLAAALARIGGWDTATAFASEGAVVMAVGSRDPITLAQVVHLRAAVPDLRVIAAPDGRVTGGMEGRGPTLFQAIPGPDPAPEDVVAARFGAGVAAALRGQEVGTLLATGGDTALALVRALGVDVVHPRGEVLPGMPWSRIAVPGHGTISLVTKSGGFGAPDALMSMLRLEAADVRH